MKNTEKHERQPRGDEPQNVWEEFGLGRPKYEDERAAPPVDREALRALVERRLPEDQRRELYRLTLRFRSWAEALAELDAEALRKEMGEPDGPRG
jgi:hypothetical protein